MKYNPGMPSKNTYAKSFSEQLTLRGLLIGALGSIVITTSSMYVALRMGRTALAHDFCCDPFHLGLETAGQYQSKRNQRHPYRYVSGRYDCRRPCLYITGTVDAETKCGNRDMASDDSQFSRCDIGNYFHRADSQTLHRKRSPALCHGHCGLGNGSGGDEGGGKAKTLFSTLGLTAVFVVLRDWFGKIPAAWVPESLNANNILFGVWVSPMASAIGYIIGTLYTGVWFIGAALSYFIIIPLGIYFEFFENVAAASDFKNSLGIGLMVGTGIGILLKTILPKAKEIYGPLFRRAPGKKNQGKEGQSEGAFLRWIPLLFAVAAFLLVSLAQMSPLPAVLTILGVWITTAMAAAITGETAINPMEVFGIIVLLAVKFLFKSDTVELVLIAAVVAAACGLTGDILNDFKAGHILKTNPRAQIISESVGAVIGAIVSVVVLIVMFKAYGQMGPNTELPAPQAFVVSKMIGGLPHMPAFIVGLITGVVLYLLRVPGLTLGIGVYLPMTISATVFLGGIARWIHDRRNVRNDDEKESGKGVVIASGMLGGEGVTGVILAILRVATLK